MSGRIWLITEDENDYKIIKCIVEDKLKLPIKVKWRSPSGKTPGLSRLAAELKKLIKEARSLRSGNDCIVVLHDEDTHRQPNRDSYNNIRLICQSEGVSLIVAKDELEAWLLSDSGVCKWLDEAVKTWNGDRWPQIVYEAPCTLNTDFGIHVIWINCWYTWLAMELINHFEMP